MNLNIKQFPAPTFAYTYTLLGDSVVSLK